MFFPPAIDIPDAVAATRGTAIGIGGQNIYWGKEGAFTGEISADMLVAAGASWVLLAIANAGTWWRTRAMRMF